MQEVASVFAEKIMQGHTVHQYCVCGTVCVCVWQANTPRPLARVCVRVWGSASCCFCIMGLGAHLLLAVMLMGFLFSLGVPHPTWYQQCEHSAQHTKLALKTHLQSLNQCNIIHSHIYDRLCGVHENTACGAKITHSFGTHKPFFATHYHPTFISAYHSISIQHSPPHLSARWLPAHRIAAVFRSSTSITARVTSPFP